MLSSHYAAPENVYLLGDIPDASRFIHLCDLFVLFSNYEGLPMTIIEAMSQKKAVIVTNVGGLPEQVFEDTGIIIQPNDKNALADSILKMYEEPQKIPEMGKAAEEKNETIFSWKTSANKLLKFLETDF